MIWKLPILLAVVLAALTASAVGSSATTSNVTKTCTTLRAKVGPISFGQTYVSFGGCLTKMTSVDRKSTSSSATACRSLQADGSFASTHGGKTFAQFYGTGNLRNAYGRCIAAKIQSAWATILSAEVSATVACRTERADASFTSSHGGKTFAQYYGTNADDSNAFGICVTQKSHPLTIAAQQPAQEPSTQVQAPPKGNASGGCGGPIEAGSTGPNHPLVASCTVAGTN